MLNDQFTMNTQSKKKDFNNISNLKESITTRPTSKKYILKSDKKTSKRMQSAYPHHQYKIKRNNTANHMKNHKKIYSSQNH